MQPIEHLVNGIARQRPPLVAPRRLCNFALPRVAEGAKDLCHAWLLATGYWHSDGLQVSYAAGKYVFEQIGGSHRRRVLYQTSQARAIAAEDCDRLGQPLYVANGHSHATVAER